MECLMCKKVIDETNDSFVKSNGTLCQQCYDDADRFCSSDEYREEDHA